MSRDMGAFERKPRSKPCIAITPGLSEARYADGSKGNKPRECCPATEYRHLLSPETRKRLEEWEAR